MSSAVHMYGAFSSDGGRRMTARTAPTSVFNMQERPSSLRLDFEDSFPSSWREDRFSMRMKKLVWKWKGLGRTMMEVKKMKVLESACFLKRI